jgi:hypothetical protein
MATFGGTYRHADGRSIVVHSRPGITIEAECKGGAIETRHRGRLSRLDKGLCEIVGRLMSKPSLGRQVAVVPRTAVTLRLARKLAPRCAAAGIRIALVGDRGDVEDVEV